VFEKHYAFDIEALKKQNLGKSVSDLEGIRGITSFVVDYVTQHALGGHAIPTSQGTLAGLTVLGVITEAEAKKNHAPGLERAIPKAKGLEFASVLHQFGADFYLSAAAPKVKEVVAEVDPAAKDRLPTQSLQEAGSAPHVEHALTAVPPASDPQAPPESPLVAASAGESGSPTAAPKRRRRKGEPGETADAAEPAPEPAGEDPNAGTPGRSPTKQLTRKKPR
jgi:endonuclease-3